MDKLQNLRYYDFTNNCIIYLIKMDSPDVVLKKFDFVSRETNEKIVRYFELLKKWNKGSFLVQKDTVETFYSRHAVDSLQIYNDLLKYKGKSFADIGTGSGMPGVFLSICGISPISLVEINEKKCIFLKEVRRNLSLDFDVCNSDIRFLDQRFDVITSRALAPLIKLFDLSLNVSRETTVYYFFKGENWFQEVNVANGKYSFKYEIIPSITSEKSCILKVENLEIKPLV